MYVLLFGGASLMQDAIGAIIDLLPLAADGGYVPESYRAVFGGLLALQVVTFLWFLWAGRRPA